MDHSETSIYKPVCHTFYLNYISKWQSLKVILSYWSFWQSRVIIGGVNWVVISFLVHNSAFAWLCCWRIRFKWYINYQLIKYSSFLLSDIYILVFKWSIFFSFSLMIVFMFVYHAPKVPKSSPVIVIVWHRVCTPYAGNCMSRVTQTKMDLNSVKAISTTVIQFSRPLKMSF